MYSYDLSGLRVLSEAEIPFAPALPVPPDVPDVQIIFVDDVGVPEPAIRQGQRFVAADQDFTFHPSPDLGLRITQGKTILIAKTPEAPDRDVRAFLTGSAWGVLCHQRRTLPLHCSAVGIGSTALAMTGTTGMGKSTLAAALALRGLGMISDDVVVVDPDASHLRLWGLPKGLKLSPATVDHLALRGGDFVGADTGKDKVYVDSALAQAPGPFTGMALYVLADGDTVTVQRVQGGDVIETLYAAIYRKTWMPMIRPRGEVFAKIAALAAQIRVFRFSRPRDMAAFDAGADVLAHHMQTQAAQETG